MCQFGSTEGDSILPEGALHVPRFIRAKQLVRAVFVGELGVRRDYDVRDIGRVGLGICEGCDGTEGPELPRVREELNVVDLLRDDVGETARHGVGESEVVGRFLPSVLVERNAQYRLVIPRRG